MYEVQQLIAGAWTDGSGGATTFEVASPFDGRPVSRVPVATPDDVTAAVKAARDAAPRWARTDPAARAAAVHRAADALEADADELAGIMHAEMGKPVADARGSIDAGIGTLRQYAELGPVHRGRTLAGQLATRST